MNEQEKKEITEMTEAAKYLALHDPQGFVIAKSNMDILKVRRGKMADRVSIIAVSIAAFLTAINQISIIITAKQLWMQQQQLQQQLERLQKERSEL